MEGILHITPPRIRIIYYTNVYKQGDCNNRIMLGGNGGNITHYSSCKNNILTFINKEIATIG